MAQLSEQAPFISDVGGSIFSLPTHAKRVRQRRKSWVFSGWVKDVITIVVKIKSLGQVYN